MMNTLVVHAPSLLNGCGIHYAACPFCDETCYGIRFNDKGEAESPCPHFLRRRVSAGMVVYFEFADVQEEIANAAVKLEPVRRTLLVAAVMILAIALNQPIILSAQPELSTLQWRVENLERTNLETKSADRLARIETSLESLVYWFRWSGAAVGGLLIETLIRNVKGKNQS